MSSINSDQEFESNIEINKDSPKIWEIFSKGGTITLSLLILIFFISSIIVIGLELVNQFFSLDFNFFGLKTVLSFVNPDPKAFGYLIYMLNWAPILDFPLPANIGIEQWIMGGFLVSIFQICFFILGIHFEPSNNSPWWEQFRKIQLPKYDGFLLGVICLLSSYLITIFFYSFILPVQGSGLLRSISDSFGSLLDPSISLILILIVVFLLTVILTSFFFQLALIVLYEDWKDYEGSFMIKMNNIKKYWYEGAVLYLAFPITLIMFLLGGSILLFFPVLFFNFLTNGSFLIPTGAWMTQIMEIIIISTLFLYPAYPALTWGLYYKKKLAINNYNKKLDNLNIKLDNNSK
ncbi:MAG: hypothetical protein HeimC3_24570 [Candidatus Heimdallarchaeota archaeon LC_3]|nr:MAG: hypothetical protein HeimC3_24570 [Candidatus Heimdallarchaeota archaeon LC_3]